MIIILFVSICFWHVLMRDTANNLFLQCSFLLGDECLFAELKNTDSNDDVPGCVNHGARPRLYIGEYTVPTACELQLKRCVHNDGVDQDHSVTSRMYRSIHW
jgi:hypothetical protein